MGNLFKQRTLIDQKYLKDKNKRVGNSNNWAQDNLENYNQEYFERFDTYEGLFNTQQFLGSIDFADFTKHCFFNSAVSKVEYVFNQIYDDFPVDGTEEELQNFYKNLDGFGRYIYNQLDKNIGYLKFNDSYLEVQNRAGYLTSFNRNDKIVSKLTKAILNPVRSSFAFDFRIYITYDQIQSVNNQVIFQYLDKSNSKKNGFTLFIKNFETLNDIVYANLIFHASNITNNSKLAAKFKVKVNSWQHISLSINNIVTNLTQNSKQIKLWINAFEQTDFKKLENFNTNDYFEISDATNFYLGKGESHTITDQEGIYNLPANPEYFTGYIDEFRYLHQSIDRDWIVRFKDDNIFAQDLLKLYFKFNEPSGIYEKNMFCFDSSGNSLHSKIQLRPFITNDPNVVNVIRQRISDLRFDPLVDAIKVSLKFEKDENNPSLMPTYTNNKLLNQNLIEEAKEYDIFNPNLIFKLFPKHYFDEGAQFEGLSENYKNKTASTYYILDADSTDDDTLNYPGQQKNEGVQTFARLLLIWAKFFDEIKIYLDVMPKLINIDYGDIASANNAVNFFLPLMAKKSGFQFKEIMNSPTSKLLDGYIIGTDGVDKSEFSLRFVQNELWKRILINSRDMIQSKGTKNAIRSIFNSVGIIPEEYYRFREYGKSQSRFIESSLLQKIKNIKFLDFNKSENDLQLDLRLSYLSNKLSYKNDSYSFEFFIHYAYMNKDEAMSEVLFSLKNIQNDEDVLKIVYEKQNHDKLGNLKCILKLKDNTETTLQIEQVNLLENKVSHIALIIDNKDTLQRNITLTLQHCNKDLDLKTQQLVQYKGILNPFKLFDNEKNKIITCGNSFSGQISTVRIWKNELTLNDLNMHALDLTSIANSDFKLLNVKNISELLLLNLTLQDDNFYINNVSKNIYPIDFSENNVLPSLDTENTYPFKIYSQNLTPEDFLTFNTIISYDNDFKFDEPNVDNKVNILSFENEDLVTKYNAELTPVYEVNYDKQKKNDVRFSIEMSNVKHLNEDMGKLFESIDFFADIISDFGALNDPIYNKFEKFSDFYFKRIKSQTIQMTPLYDLYQIFDNILSEMLQDFVSSRVKFKNNIYVIESHALERHKFHYKFMESHVVMKGDMNTSSNTNSKKSFNYLKLEGRRLLQ